MVLVIDGVAHEAVINGSGTIAVLSAGVEIVYPAAHRDLYIVSSSITERSYPKWHRKKRLIRVSSCPQPRYFRAYRSGSGSWRSDCFRRFDYHPVGFGAVAGSFCDHGDDQFAGRGRNKLSFKAGSQAGDRHRRYFSRVRVR